MDWVKVCHQLDDEWWLKKRKADFETSPSEQQRLTLLADLAFMLRDCLVAGLSELERDRYDLTRSVER